KNTKAPQNSIASLQEAVKLGCEGSEFDVHMTADEVTILYHDRDAEGLPLEKTSFERLSKLRLSNGESIPTLTAFLEAGMQQNTTKLILEIKPSAVSKERGIALAEKVVKQVQELKAQAWVDYISFDYDMLKKVLELDPYANVAYLNGDKAPAEVAEDKFYGLDYNQKVFREKTGWIEEAKEHQLTLNVWTVNDGESLDWFLEKGFDFITTDEPELLLKKVKEN
ncbi:MAG TPA: glycerophosphodiester phosphodiesterase family protein, partial [Anseongella sp.]|nr:glycerophosphodiester phosphodiesterase family protein [Anseongella sp.]